MLKKKTTNLLRPAYYMLDGLPLRDSYTILFENIVVL